MGVDYYACKNCGDTFPDCGDYVSCECREHWCSDDCAGAGGYQVEEDGFTPEGSKWEQETSCNFCRKEEFEDLQLLELAQELLGKSRQELISLYKNKI